MGRRPDVDVLLRAIQAEAECALRRADFGPHVEHIHRLVTVIEGRMKQRQLKEQQTWLDQLMDRTAPVQCVGRPRPGARSGMKRQGDDEREV